MTPFGELVALPGRGLMMGNRGILHGENRRIVRFWQVRRWIVCVLKFRGRHRGVMTPHRYTELFFLDEATALAAGHRPCHECRYADYRRFQALWRRCGLGIAGADAMDRRLHTERIDGKQKRTYRCEIATLPDGVYVASDGRPWLLWDGNLHAWSDCGYEHRRRRPRAGQVEVLTPQSIVAVLSAGYRPGVHPSCTGTRALATGTNHTA